jgi:GGDEF domain-containing protein
MPVDPAFLKLFADRYLLKGLNVVALNTRADPSQTGILARDENGKPLASFVWTPLDPGYSMLRDLLPPIAGICVLLALVGFFQARRIASLAQSLIQAQEYWRDMASHDASTELPNRLRFVEQLSFEISCLDDDRHSLAIQCVQVGLAPGRIGRSDADIDELAEIAAQRLTRICRQEALVSRLSRDRFGILSIGAGAMEAKALEKRLVAALSAPVSLARGHCDALVDVATTIVSNNAAEAMAVLMQTEEALGLNAPVLDLRPAR